MEWQNLCTDLNVDPIENLSIPYLKVKLFEILESVEAEDKSFNINKAQSSTFHDLYNSLSYDNLSYFKDQYSAHQISIILKARGGLLNINARAFKDNTDGLCTLCNLGMPENTLHHLGECPIFSNTRYLIFGKKFLSKDDVLKILNGDNFNNLYDFLNNSLQYRNLIINEFS